MFLSLLLLSLGIGLLLGGGHALVRGASRLARALGVPALVIGLTVVAFGTSAPELSVNLTGALTARSDISFGNVVGSNLANLGFILGVAALIQPLTVHSRVIQRELPMMLLATAAFTVMSFDMALRGQPGQLDRSDGLVLLLFFSVFVYTAWTTIRRQKATDRLLQRSIETVGKEAPARIVTSAALVVAGFLGLAAGGALTVQNAAQFGELVGLPPAVIAFSVVAVGTSLPELVTSIIASRQGEADMAIGNVVGSNIFNLLFIMGITAAVRPVEVPPGGLEDLLAVVAASLLLLPLALIRRQKIERLEGAILVSLWLMYTIWRLVPH